MKTNLKNYGHFTKAQIRGIFLLTGLILGSFFLTHLYSKFSPKETTDFTEVEKEIVEFEENLVDRKKDKIEKGRKNKSTIQLFDFDPNTVSKEGLISLGLSSSVAKTFIKYRNTGAKFYKKEDLKKIYGIKEIDYQRLAPYIKIEKPQKIFTIKTPNKTKKQPIKKVLTPFKFNPNEADKATLLKLGISSKVVQTILNYRNSGAQFWKKEDFRKVYGLTETDYKTLSPYIDIPKKVAPISENTTIPKNIPENFSTRTTIKIDINNSTIEEWKQLRGIGEITAKRIVNFRDKLGGFVSIEQLKTTYNIADSTIDKVAHQLILSPIVTKIPINTISAEALKMHPYVKKKQAYLIVNYRVNRGRYSNSADLKKVKALTPEFIEQLSPYLSFE